MLFRASLTQIKLKENIDSTLNLKTDFMAIGEKLDKIIEILLRIEGKLNCAPDHDADQEQLQEQPVVYEKETKPTASQLKFQSQMEINISMNRKFFLKAIRNQASKLMEIREIEPGFKISYISPQKG